MTELAGVMMGNYFLLECLGREGMVETYLARPTNHGGYDITLRLFHPSFPDPTLFQERFPVEVRKLWRCQHTYIEPLVEFGEGEGLLYTATRPEFSTTLAHLLDRQDSRNFSLPFIIEIMTQLGEALQYAHDHKVVHGNLQPSSILINQGGQTRLTNFALKQAYQAGDPAIAQIGEGNAAYVAPEQVVGMLTPASDIYSLGVLLYRLLGGELPYDGNSDGEIALLHTNEPIPSLRQLRPDLPEAVEMVARMALAKNSAARFASPRAFVDALIKALVEDEPPIITIRPARRISVSARRTSLTWSRAFSVLALLLVFTGLISALSLFSFPNLPMMPLHFLSQQGGPGAIPITLPQIGPFEYPAHSSGTGIVASQTGSGQTQQPAPGQTGTTPGTQAGSTPQPAPTNSPGSTPVVTPTISIQQSPIVSPYTPTVTTSPPPLTCVPGALSIAGSFYLAPLLQQVGSDYQIFCPGQVLTVSNQGSRNGLIALENGQVNLADSDLSVKNPQNLTDYPVAALLYSVIVSPDVAINGLSSQQLEAIYQGQITNWSQIGGPDEAIRVLLHPQGETLKTIFRHFILNGKAEHVPGGMQLGTNVSPAQMVQMVAQTAGAITYVPLDATYNAGVRVLALNRVLPNVQNLLHGFYPFWSIEHIYAQGSAPLQGQAYIQFLLANQEVNRMAQSGAVPFNLLPASLAASHLTGPYITL